MTKHDPLPKIARSDDPAADKRAALQGLIPEAFSEGRLDLDALKRTLGESAVVAEGERYRLDWVGKSEAYRTLQAPTSATLLPDREQSVNFDTARHAFIEGENLEVLKVLQKAYFGQVKLIYIDPPYNTGSDQFVYPDRFQESKEDYLKRIQEMDDQGALLREGQFRKNSRESGHYHSNWLSMMLPRLYIARNLLREDGVIFVSIDDNEVHNLRLLMNEIFGPENFRGQISRGTGTPTGQGTSSLVNEKDYLLVYSKSGEFEFNGLPFSEDDIARYNLKDDLGREYLIRPLRKTGGEDRREDRPSMYFKVEAPDGKAIYPEGPDGYQSRWRCGRKKYEAFLEEGRIEWKSKTVDGVKSWTPYLRFYLEGRTKQPSNTWFNLPGNKQATRHLKSLIGKSLPLTPKPVALISRCLQVDEDDSALVLDFFAGSGTTMEAVIRQNAEDGGNRRCILVQMTEPLDPDNAEFSDIAQVARTRIRAALHELKASAKEGSGLPTDEGFRAFKLVESHFPQWRPQAFESGEALAEQIQLFMQAGVNDADPEALALELLLKSGYPLTIGIRRVELGGVPVLIVDHEEDEGRLVLLLEAFSTDTLSDLVALQPSRIIALERIFDGSDAAKKNLALQCRDADIRFESY